MEYILKQEHSDEIKEIMKQTNTTFMKWNGKEFWKLSNECGHTSLDFNRCECRNQKMLIKMSEQQLIG